MCQAQKFIFRQLSTTLSKLSNIQTCNKINKVSPDPTLLPGNLQYILNIKVLKITFCDKGIDIILPN